MSYTPMQQPNETEPDKPDTTSEEYATTKNQITNTDMVIQKPIISLVCYNR